jgi:hypothetical protein
MNKYTTHAKDAVSGKFIPTIPPIQFGLWTGSYGAKTCMSEQGQPDYPFMASDMVKL